MRKSLNIRVRCCLWSHCFLEAAVESLLVPAAVRTLPSAVPAAVQRAPILSAATQTAATSVRFVPSIVSPSYTYSTKTLGNYKTFIRENFYEKWPEAEAVTYHGSSISMHERHGSSSKAARKLHVCTCDDFAKKFTCKAFISSIRADISLLSMLFEHFSFCLSISKVCTCSRRFCSNSTKSFSRACFSVLSSLITVSCKIS